MSTANPNLVLVVFDTARADSLEPYGAPSGSSPALRDFASAGWAARSGYATSNWTVPSHLSMFTGLLPREAGLAPRMPPEWVVLHHANKTLASVLSGHGYATLGASANVWISPQHGFDRGFESFVLPAGHHRSPPRSGLARAGWMLEALRARTDDGLAAIEAVMDGWMAALRGAPSSGSST